MVGRELRLNFLFVQNALNGYQRYSVRDLLTNPMKGRHYSEHFNWVCLYLCHFVSTLVPENFTYNPKTLCYNFMRL